MYSKNFQLSPRLSSETFALDEIYIQFDKFRKVRKYKFWNDFGYFYEGDVENSGKSGKFG